MHEGSGHLTTDEEDMVHGYGLGKLLEIGPGAVIPLDRQVTDPVDLIIGDKVVARGEVVLVQGKFGLRVTEVVAG
jgi:flagellar motor switch/type III secretory pathway protein FliN